MAEQPPKSLADHRRKKQVQELLSRMDRQIPQQPPMRGRDTIKDATQRYGAALSSGDDLARAAAAAEIYRLQGQIRGAKTLAHIAQRVKVEEEMAKRIQQEPPQDIRRGPLRLIRPNSPQEEEN